MKLDALDKKLISYLYHHYREPLTKIAKQFKVSRDQIEYRLRKYEKEGLIKKYLTIFNYPLLGYREFIVAWLKTTGENRGAIKREFEAMKNVISVGEVIGDYDLFVDFVFRDKYEFESVFYSFLEKNKASILAHSMFITTYAGFFPLKTFGAFNAEKTYGMVNPASQAELSEKDLSILKLLEKNGRTRIIDIAKKTGISSELIVYKLKQLYKNKVILGTRIQLDMEKLGFYFGVLKIKLRNQTENLKKKIEFFCERHAHVNALSFGISDTDCLVQVLYQEENEFRQAIRDFNRAFEKEIEQIQILLIENEGKVKTLPY